MSVSLSEKISSIYKITAKQERSAALKNLRKEAVSTFATEEYSDKVIKDELDKLEAKSVRDLIFTGIPALSKGDYLQCFIYCELLIDFKMI